LNTMPYLARLVEAVPNLQMRIIGSKRGRKVLKAHRTPDGRTATPTVILLDDGYRESGCWVERPAELQRWFQQKKKTLSERELHDQKYAWYANDKGDQTIREIVEMLASAAAGRPTCGKKR
ncbi:MAG: thioredoxin family protein, partial [Gemmatimonadaceae bacterium]